jgi:hypothetical protein
MPKASNNYPSPEAWIMLDIYLDSISQVLTSHPTTTAISSCLTELFTIVWEDKDSTN